MILPSFIVPSQANLVSNTKGTDSVKLCFNKNHFLTYPHQVSYSYNSRGYRDSEWPTSINELRQSIWCIGDSATTGIGNVLEHTWVNILQTATDTRCINVSMEGASNDWIARKAVDVLTAVKPKTLVIHWSYFHRGELDDKNLSDEERRVDYKFVFERDQLANLLSNISKVNSNRGACKIIHSFIPVGDWLFVDPQDEWDKVKGSSWPPMPLSQSDFKMLPKLVVKELKDFGKSYDILSYHIENKSVIDAIYSELGKSIYIKSIEVLDYARDFYHYGPLTARAFVDKILKAIA